jgi:DNA topoisomerase-3
MTPQAIRDGFDKLRSDAQMRGLADAARSRSEADWLVGINGTRAMTAFNSRDGGFFLTTVGRVQTPTLSIVVEREEKIRKHVLARLLGGQGQLRRAGRPVRRQVVRPGLEEEPRRRRSARRPAVERGRCPGHRRRRARAAAHVTEEAKPSTQAAPLLYDLTTLQREANALRLQCQDHAQHRAGAVREAQGADLPADRQPRPARGLPGAVKQTIAMLAEEDLPGPLRELARTRARP